MHRRFAWTPAGTAAIVAAVAVVLAGACSGDDERPASTTAPNGAANEETAVPTAEPVTPAPDVTLTATVRLERGRVLFDYVLANTGDEDVAVVDVASVIDTLATTGDDAYRAAFLRTSGDATAGAPLPFLQGLVVPAGDELTGTAAITGRFDRVPATVQLCIEVVPQPWTDAGGGVAELPYRPVDAVPVLACTDQLAVPDGG
jgi:hypothetical protein